ncbi:hypothetical protein ACR3H8_20310 [Pseudomonas aeruginosa]|uniref:hypothetical protein n=1 Tax=Pseudomonas aeruginosa group TaxID=136841 RepID=UPI0003BB3C63|nr:hypothetical protein [Pseudomonas aeruginosa]EIU2716062.1 hypothetical protein [Pseudomonas aeruginosa]EIU2863647.1 hypothetical protein [Pseudomonas aeruginosa]ELD5772859.1 hypothetical protein [Pseudomonas aeruginosa]ERW61315.1 hypothetical protein Q024_06362 [Pseudomonas aeruginosa BWHPSA011]ETV28788.1 hypothetical protein Q046_05705 [Pseudomonas aeruginosa BWHPSA041]
MSLMENVSPVYEEEDGHLVEAVASTLMAEFLHLEQLEEGVTIRVLAERGDPRAVKCVTTAGVLVNYLREELA